MVEAAISMQPTTAQYSTSLNPLFIFVLYKRLQVDFIVVRGTLINWL